MDTELWGGGVIEQKPTTNLCSEYPYPIHVAPTLGRSPARVGQDVRDLIK